MSITCTLYVQKLSGDMECIKQTQIYLLEMKTAMSEMKNTLDRTKSRLETAEEKITELEGNQVHFSKNIPPN